MNLKRSDNANNLGILLLNTGSPRTCAPHDVRRYLTQFLMDGRVLDLPYWMRKIVVNCLIVPFRYKKSAKNYARIWTAEGSPLVVHTSSLVEKLKRRLGANVQLGLSYSEPSIAEGLKRLQGCRQLFIVPLFPQYASATSGSVIQEVMRTISTWQVIPELTIQGPFSHHDLFLDAWSARAEGIDIESYDHVLFSFHGLPLRQVAKQDRFGCCLKRGCCNYLHEQNGYCYPAQCRDVAHALAERLAIKDFTLCYQSRLGVDKWLGPYTSSVIKERRKRGDKRLLVFAPSFVADCLETLYEIGMEYRDEFLMLGGDTLDLVPSLNAEDFWADALAEIIRSDAE